MAATNLTDAQLTAFHDLALELALEAGQLAADAFRHSEARRKGDGTLVTLADERNDQIITAGIKAAHPDHAVLSEEQDTVYDPANEFTWVIDPIDGTTNFARGLLIWGVSIALLHHGQPVVGVVHFPLLQETYAAIIGRMATRNGEKIKSAADKEAGDQQLIMQCTRTARHYRVETPLKARILGSAAYHMTKVADGAALASIETTPKIWDLAAVALILSEAGALLTTLDGEPIFPTPAVRHDYLSHAYPSLAAANEDIYRQVFPAILPR
jgi:myo-inositol-1(or 4)-monophosphatase